MFKLLSYLKYPQPSDHSLIRSFFFFLFFFSELLQELENCENDPVAIAECFVSKVSRVHLSEPTKTETETHCFHCKVKMTDVFHTG